MRTGVSTSCLYPMELERAFEMLAVRKIGTAEIFVNTDCELNDPYLSQMLALQKEYGVNVCSVHPYTCGIEPMMLFTQYERRANDMLEYFKRFFEYMNLFGAGIFVLHGNKLQNQCDDELYFERFFRLQQTAAQFGVSVAQENVSRCTSRSLSFMRKMAQTLGSDAKFVLDTKQAHRSDEDPIEIIRSLKSHIVHVHFSDYGKEGDCLKFGFGEYDNTALFTELKNNGYSGSIIIELYRHNFKDADDLADNYRKLDSFLSENGFAD